MRMIDQDCFNCPKFLDRPYEQTLQTQISLFLEEQSDKDLQFAIPFASFGIITPW